MSDVVPSAIRPETDQPGPPSRSSVELVIVATDCERFADFVAAGRRGEIGLHFCVDARSAVRLARRFRADIWLVTADLPDMSGPDLLEILLPLVAQAGVDPLLGGARISLDRLGSTLHSGVFLLGDAYAFEQERRALQAGAGYLAGPVSMDLLRDSRGWVRSGRSAPPVVIDVTP